MVKGAGARPSGRAASVGCGLNGLGLGDRDFLDSLSLTDPKKERAGEAMVGDTRMLPRHPGIRRSVVALCSLQWTKHDTERSGWSIIR